MAARGECASSLDPPRSRALRKAKRFSARARRSPSPGKTNARNELRLGLNWNLTKGEAVIVVSHQGNSVYEKLLEEVEGIDIVVGAHSRDLITPPERVGGG